MLTWPRALLALVVAGLIGTVAGWQLHPDPPPGVDLEVALRAASSWRTRTTSSSSSGPVHLEQGPSKTTTRTFHPAAPPPPPAPGCAPCPACEETEVITETGPLVVDVGASSTTSTAEGSGASLVIAREKLVVTPPPPAPRPGWGLSAAALLTREGLGVQVGVGRRLIGPVWLEATASTALAASLGVRMEF